MAEPLTFLAEEIARTFTLVWGGVCIAIKLNNEIMSSIIIFTTRIVQLLLLLTQKTADVISILGSDIFAFFGDVGTGVLALSNTIQSLGSGLLSAFEALLTSFTSAITFVILSIQALGLMIVDGVAGFMNVVEILCYYLKYGFVFVGSSAYFAVAFIPDLLSTLGAAIAQTVSERFLKCSTFVQNLINNFKKNISVSLVSLGRYFFDIPVRALVGFCLIIAFFYGLRYFIKYVYHNSTTLFSHFNIIPSVERTIYKLINWCSSLRIQSTQPQGLNSEDTDNDEVSGSPRIVRNQAPFIPDTALENSSSSFRAAQGLDSSQSTSSPSLTRKPMLRSSRKETLENCSQTLKPRFNDLDMNKSNKLKSAESCDLASNLLKELKEEREEKLCIVCQDRMKCIILLPCRHLCLCDLCRSAVIIRDNSCPICRKLIIDSLKVYL